MSDDLLPDGDGIGQDLTPAQTVALSALLEGASISEAARRAKVTRQTVSAWRNHGPDFMRALAEGRAELRERLLDALTCGALRAVVTLTDALAGEAQIKAASELLRGVVAVSRVGAAGPTGPAPVIEEPAFSADIAERLPQEVRAAVIRALRGGEPGSAPRMALPVPLDEI